MTDGDFSADDLSKSEDSANRSLDAVESPNFNDTYNAWLGSGVNDQEMSNIRHCKLL
ncbi:hypothetical protein TcasGA2_TC007338 [Tribolium castaneum]|uniref:Uncharacterized protein n=1 Tax=Tribolium castaneum TaxID=7070 RepID=D2A061_TRICA|nr:hypothetical protein TcasGA2_TC007338 [Tribolium castaneum]